MKVVYISTDINSRIRTMLKLKFNVQPIHIKNGADAKSTLIREDDISIILADSNVENCDTLVAHLKKTNSIIPYIDVSDGEIGSPLIKDFLENQEDIVRAPSPIDVKVLESIIRSALDVYMNKLERKYHEVRIESLENLKSICCDIFIKLSPYKYVKYIEGGSEFTSTTIQDLLKRKIRSVYIEDSDIEQFSAMSTKGLLVKLDETNLSTEEKHLLSIVSNETIKQNLKNLGISPLTLELGHKSLVNTASIFCKHKKLETILDNLCSADNYESEHCVVISYVGMAMINVSEWNTPVNHLKICSSALLHDASLIGTGLASIGDIDSPMFRKLDKKKQTAVLENPAVSADLLLRCKIFPEEAHNIILEQGERPGGSGYPKGLDSSKISPLSAVFILAHDFVHKIYHLGMNERNREIVLAELEAKYTEGNFQKSYGLLERAISKKSA